ncbi:MAG TPA: hypothetical protein VMN60_04535 [Longimicrobiales bacterium]|nr:hypothetical protein [Longimicrobiales bacterium]
MSSRLEYAADEPRTVDEARDAVERSRQRISSTLDALEDRIVEKKQALRDRVDVVRPVKEQVSRRPFTAIAVAVGVGALLGSLGGGSQADRSSRDDSRSGHEGGLSAAERGELREWRRHRRERMEARNRVRERAWQDEHSGPSALDKFRSQLMGAVTAAIGAAVTAKVKDLMGTRGNGRKDGRRR